MKRLKIISKRFGEVYTLLDDPDFERILKLGGKWTIKKSSSGSLYACKKIGGKTLDMHRFIIQPKEEESVDHINHNSLDNRRSNLRTCTHAANCRNGKLRSNNRSGVTGVRWDRKTEKWLVRIIVNYKEVFLGRHNTLTEAKKVRQEGVKKYWNS